MQPMGGTASLSLEDSEDPYLHGVKFSAMPPTKRYREMEQLSGGEKVTFLIVPVSGLPTRLWTLEELLTFLREPYHLHVHSNVAKASCRSSMCPVAVGLSS